MSSSMSWIKVPDYQLLGDLTPAVTNLRHIDLNLLVALDAMQRERHVTRAVP